MDAIPYLILIALLAFLYFGERNKIKDLSKNTSIILAYSITLFFIGLRGHVMSDFLNYYPYFQEIPPIYKLTINNFDLYFEPGFVVYTSLIKTICPNYFGWIFISTFIDLVVLKWFFKKYSQSQVLPLIFFLVFGGFFLEFNLLRNVKAIDCFLLSFPFLINRRFLPFLVLNIVGFTFHSSSALYILIYFILTLRFSPLLLWGGIIIVNIIFIFNLNIITEFINNLSIIKSLDFYQRIAGYTASAAVNKFSIGYFERLFAIIIFTIFRGRLEKDNAYFRIFYNSYWLYYITYLFFYEVQVFVDRIPMLFIYSYWILYSAVVRLKYQYRPLINIFIVLLSLLKVYVLAISPGSKYSNVLFNKVDYDKSAVEIERILIDRQFN